MTATTQNLTLPLSRGPLRRVLQVGVGALASLGVIGAAVVVASGGHFNPIAPGTARILPGDAAVTVHPGTPGVAADALLRAGDTLTVSHGVAAIRTSLGTLYASPGSSVAITSGAPRITRGDVLVDGHGIVVEMRAARATVDGITRVRQGLTLETDVYRGGAVVRTATETVGVAVPRLRRAIVTGDGSSSVATAPLVLNAADQWDRRFLGSAIELDAALNARSRGLTMQVASGVVDKVVAATGFRDLTALRDQPVGEVVVAAELARAAHLGDAAVVAALRMRSEGASWGLIAIEQGVHSPPAPLAGIDDVAVPIGTAGAVAQVPPTNLATVPSPAVKAPAVTVPPAVSIPGTHSPVTMPPTPPQPSNVVATLVDDVDNLLGGLLGH